MTNCGRLRNKPGTATAVLPSWETKRLVYVGVIGAWFKTALASGDRQATESSVYCWQSHTLPTRGTPIFTMSYHIVYGIRTSFKRIGREAHYTMMVETSR